MTPEPTNPITPVAAPAPADELEIKVIPEEFYGGGVRMTVEEKKPAAPAPAAQVMPLAPQKSRLPVIIAVVVLLMAIGGGFIYFNRSLLFPAPAAPQIVVETPEPIEVPAAPTDVSATSTNYQSISLIWTDVAADESGFRLERRAGDGAFASLTSLPPNSTSFLDLSVESGTTYTYRLLALNEAGESAPSNEASATVPSSPLISARPELPPAGLDTDSDGVTDLEEGLYGTDVRKSDTDSDGFLDGNEVFHLYNPAGVAPVKLLDSALVKVNTAPVGWVISIPTPWGLVFNTTQGTKATIDTKHGELFTITIEENPERKSIAEWYAEKNPGVNAMQVMPFRSKGGYEGIVGTDLLTTYIPWGDRVFVLAYELNGQPFINYRTTYSMMLNSLILSGMPEITPPLPGAELPFEPSATPTSVETSVGEPTPAT
jgi:hypothetical protein